MIAGEASALLPEDWHLILIRRYGVFFYACNKHKDSDMTPKKDNRLTDPSEMGIQELMDLLIEHGYTTSALSNDEILDLAYEIFDGNDYEEEGDPDEIY